MVRLNCIAEGVSEQNFFNRTLAPVLAEKNIIAQATCVLTSKEQRRGRQHKGGLKNYLKARNHIQTWLKQESKDDVRFTTMFDLYALPNNFPGCQEANKIVDPYKRIDFLENKFKENILDSRFFPYIQLHEFETLIFVDPSKLADEYFHINHIEKAVKQLTEMKKNVKNQNPGYINDSPDKAPSKRILKLIPDYDKRNIGPLIVDKIGLDNLRADCKHFNEWLLQIENFTL